MRKSKTIKRNRWPTLWWAVENKPKPKSPLFLLNDHDGHMLKVRQSLNMLIKWNLANSEFDSFRLVFLYTFVSW